VTGANFFIMNKAFTKSKVLVLDANYLIKPDNANGVILLFTEERLRTKEDKTLENWTFKEEFNYPRIAQALRAYVDRELIDDDNIEDLIEKAERLYALIDKLDKTFKQF